MSYDLYKGRLYQNWKGFVGILVFLAAILIVLAITGSSAVFYVLLGAFASFLVFDFLSYARRRRDRVVLDKEVDRVLSQFLYVLMIHLESHKFPLKMDLDVSLSDYISKPNGSYTLSDWNEMLTSCWNRYTSAYDKDAVYDCILKRFHAFCSAVVGLKSELSGIYHMLMLMESRNDCSVASLEELIGYLDRIESYEHIGGAFDSYYIYDIYSSVISKTLKVLHDFK